MTESIRILWADDEIDKLKSQLFFLEKKGYSVETVTNGQDAIDLINEYKNYDVVFLDESMPGITGLETLEIIKKQYEHLPVIMITKNEAEDLMEQAIGSQITDYLIKPVNPNQILLALKKIVDKKRLVQEKTSSDYQSEFNEIFSEINSRLTHEEWYHIYKKIIKWELKLDEIDTHQMGEIIAMQKQQANTAFAKFIEKNYEDWFDKQFKGKKPILSHTLLKEKVFPVLDDKPTVFLLLDNLRMDQYYIIKPIIEKLFKLQQEDHFYSILPTATQYSRNAIFAGMTPGDIYKYHPELWVGENDDEGKNNYEKDLLTYQIRNKVRREVSFDYTKITNIQKANHLADNVLNFLHNDLTVIVYNFIDMLSHVRTHMEVLKELASDEKAYRSLTESWFKNSPLYTALKKIAEKGARLIVTTDHGTIRVKDPVKVIGDRDTATNIRYKVGKNLSYKKNEVFEIHNPAQIGLPSANVSSKYIFTSENQFFLYPNNYNHFQRYYNNTFQHGGISIEEMIIPFAIFDSI